MERHLLLALSNPVPGREDDFNHWFDDVHIPEVMKVPGFVSGQRYELAKHQRTPAPHPYGYITAYEIDTDDLKSTLAALGAAVQAGTKTDSSDPARRALWVYSPRGRKHMVA